MQLKTAKTIEFLESLGFVHIYSGKVRDLFRKEDKLIMVATDRISAFDVIMPFLVPYKGAVLTGISAFFLRKASKIVPVWYEANPHPNVIIGKYAKPIKIEFIVRGYISGSMWRKYQKGQRVFADVSLPDNLKENQKLPSPLLTPTTKSEHGHDEDISPSEIIDRNILTRAQYEQIEDYCLKLFEDASKYALSRNLILVDTKYEFGFNSEEGSILLIDEVHTPDSSRYFYLDEYQERFEKGLPQNHLSKEILREFLIERNWQNRAHFLPEDFPPSLIEKISKTYIQIYETLTGENFNYPENMPSIEEALLYYFSKK